TQHRAPFTSSLRRPAPPRALHSFPTRRSSDLGVHAAVSPRGVGDDPRRRPVPNAPRGGVPLSRRALRSGGRARRDSGTPPRGARSEEHTSELQSRFDLVCRLLLEKKKNSNRTA